MADRQEEAKRLLDQALSHKDQQHFDSAIKLFTNGAERFGDLKDMHGHNVFPKEVVRTYLTCGKYNEAYRAAVHYQMDLSIHAILFARAYEQGGNIDAARAWWSIFSQASPDHPELISFFERYPPRPTRVEANGGARERPIDLAGLQNAVRVFQGYAETPGEYALVVLGDIRHFAGSVLGNIAKRLFTVIHGDADIENREEHRWNNIAYLKWAPYSRYEIPASLRGKLPRAARIVNDTHFNCAKDNVQQRFGSVFGYELKVDPLKHVGHAVKKSKTNAAHDGAVVMLPTSRPETQGHVYERVVENVYNSYVCDIRVPIVCGEVPLVYLKFRAINDRFSNANLWAKIVSPTDVLTHDEIAKCQQFASEIGLDYGEMDVLRDVVTGRIFIVDANNTPYGPPNCLSNEEKDVALRLLGYAVIRGFYIGRAPGV